MAILGATKDVLHIMHVAVCICIYIYMLQDGAWGWCWAVWAGSLSWSQASSSMYSQASGPMQVVLFLSFVFRTTQTLCRYIYVRLPCDPGIKTFIPMWLHWFRLYSLGLQGTKLCVGRCASRSTHEGHNVVLVSCLWLFEFRAKTTRGPLEP